MVYNLVGMGIYGEGEGRSEMGLRQEHTASMGNDQGNWDENIAGWTCPHCNMWVAPNQSHYCSGMQGYGVMSNTDTSIHVKLDRIIELLEDIKEAVE